jgi:hypothetical protein
MSPLFLNMIVVSENACLVVTIIVRDVNMSVFKVICQCLGEFLTFPSRSVYKWQSTLGLCETEIPTVTIREFFEQYLRVQWIKVCKHSTKLHDFASWIQLQYSVRCVKSLISITSLKWNQNSNHNPPDDCITAQPLTAVTISILHPDLLSVNAPHLSDCANSEWCSDLIDPFTQFQRPLLLRRRDGH